MAQRLVARHRCQVLNWQIAKRAARRGKQNARDGANRSARFEHGRGLDDGHGERQHGDGPANPGQAAPSTGGEATVREQEEEELNRALAEVSGCEQVRQFVVLPRPFTVAAEELTVSLKLRRGVVLAKYRRELDALYEGKVAEIV